MLVSWKKTCNLLWDLVQVPSDRQGFKQEIWRKNPNPYRKKSVHQRSVALTSYRNSKRQDRLPNHHVSGSMSNFWVCICSGTSKKVTLEKKNKTSVQQEMQLKYRAFLTNTLFETFHCTGCLTRFFPHIPKTSSLFIAIILVHQPVALFFRQPGPRIPHPPWLSVYRTKKSQPFWKKRRESQWHVGNPWTSDMKWMIKEDMDECIPKGKPMAFMVFF